MDEQHQGSGPVFKRVLLTVDLDDRDSSRKSFDYAVTYARDYGSTLGIVSVLENSDISIFDSMTPSKLQEKREAMTAVVDGYVADAEKAGVADVSGMVSEGGDIDDVIVDNVVPEFKPDLIICGADEVATHHRPGAVGLRIAKRAPVSVIVIR